MKIKDKTKEMLEEPVEKLITKLAVPTILSMLITSFYNMADTFFVGKLGTTATGAVGVAFPLMTIIQAMGFFFGHGSGNAVSRKLGAKDTEGAEKIASVGFFGGLFCGLIIMILGIIFINPLTMMLGSTKTILPYARSYIRILLFAAPFMSASFVLNNQMRFHGRAMFAMFAIITGAVLNVILDPILIFKFNMGVSGAAAATAISQTISFIMLLIAYCTSKCSKISIYNLKYTREQIGDIAAGGLPSLCRQGLASVATIALNTAANPYGDAAIAAMSVVGKIAFFANAVVIGFGQGFQPVCGFNYGAGNKKRVKEAFYFSVNVATVILVCFAFAGFFGAEKLIAIFRDDDMDVIRMGAFALKMQCITMPLNGIFTMSNMLYQTCKWTVPATTLSSSRQGFIFIIVVLSLSAIFHMNGVMVAQSVSDVLAFTLTMAFNHKLLKKLFE